MAYVSARYAPDIPGFPPDEEGKKRVVAVDEIGTEWHLTEDSQVGDWLRYIEEGGTIDPVQE